MKDILADEETRFLFENQPPGFWAPALPAKGVMAVTYPCRNNEILNVLAVHRKLGQHANAESDAVLIDDWNFPATHEDLERVLDGFHPAVKKMFLKSPEVKVYTQMKREPLSKMTKGKAVLIGDACHPMLLTHAQGVSSSIEDGAALEMFLADVPASKDVTSSPSEALLHRLQQFESFRLPRVSATQILTEPIIPGPQAAVKAAQQEAEIRKYYSGPLPPPGAMPHSPGICQFFFAYDVRKEAIKFLENAQTAAAQTQLATQAEKGPNEQIVSATETANSSSTTPPPTMPPTIQISTSEVPKSTITEIFSPLNLPQRKDAYTSSLEGRVADLEIKLAEMERKFEKFSTNLSTPEVTLTPPQSPPMDRNEVNNSPFVQKEASMPRLVRKISQIFTR
jgi:hypothetical protein